MECFYFIYSSVLQYVFESSLKLAGYSENYKSSFHIEIFQMRNFKINPKILKDFHWKYYKCRGYNKNYESILDNLYFIMSF